MKRWLPYVLTQASESGPKFWCVSLLLFGIGFGNAVFPTLCVANNGVSDTMRQPLLLEDLGQEFEFMREETVVTAIRQEQPISETPANVYVITAEDIKRSGATDIPTILRRVPSMEVMQTTASDFNVSVRGNNQILANKLLVLVDGRSIFLDSIGTVQWKNLPVTMPEIQRVEVLLGPASAVYGFNAFDGVVNIITKEPTDIPRTIVQVGTGELGTVTVSTVNSGRYEQFGYRVSAGWDQSQRWQDRHALSFRSYTFNLLTSYHLTPQSTVKVSGGLTDSNRLESPLAVATRGHGSPFSSYLDVVYEHPQWLLNFWWNRMDDRTELTPHQPLQEFLQTTDANGNTRIDNLINSYNLLAQSSFDVLDTKTILGLNYRHNTFAGDNVNGSFHEDRLGLYVQNEWPITPNTRTIAGIRYDLSTGISPTISPRVALLFRPAANHTFRLSYSEAFRPPTLNDQYLDVRSTVSIPSPGGPISTTSIIQGSTNLEPERIQSLELSYSAWWLQHRVRTRASVFYNKLSNLINFQPTGPVATNPVTTANISEAKIYGGEIGVEALATSWLRGWGHLAFQEIDQDITTGVNHRAGPAWKINFGVRVDGPHGLNLEILGHHVDSVAYPVSQLFDDLAPLGIASPNAKTDRYILLNVRGGFRFWDDRAELAVSVFNALNDRHREYQLADVLGSRVLGWLTLKL